MESELNAYEVRKPELGRPMDDRVTAAYIEQTPALAGVAPFDPETDVDLVADINRVIANLRALVAIADPDMVAVMQALLDEIATLRADDRTAAELLAAAGVWRYASAAERDADLPHRADGDWAWTISSSGATYHRREDGAWVERGELRAGGGVALPAGGTPGDVLTKLSDMDGDAAWQAPRPGSGGARLVRTGTAASTSYAPLVSDDFSAVELSPARWLVRSGGFTTGGGRAGGTSTTAANIATVRAAVSTSGAVQARVFGPNANVYCRYLDNANRFALGRYQGLTLSRTIGGATSVIRNWPGVVWDDTNGTVLRLEYTPTTLSVYFNGTLLETINDAALGEYGGAGMYVDGSSFIDDFTVYTAGGVIAGLPVGFAVYGGGKEVPPNLVPPGEFAVYDAGSVWAAAGVMRLGDEFVFTP